MQCKFAKLLFSAILSGFFFCRNMRYSHFFHHLAASQVNALLGFFSDFHGEYGPKFCSPIPQDKTPRLTIRRKTAIITFLASLKNVMYRACRYNNKQKFGKLLYSVKLLEVESKLAKVHSCCGVDLILHSWLLSQHCKFLEVLINALHICFGPATHN